MKIAIMSDIHADINHDEYDSLETAIINYLTEVSPDFFIIAGDVSNNYIKTLEFLDRTQNKSGIRILFVPGNHDLWNIENADKDTEYIYDQLKKFGGNLCDRPYDINSEWSVIGDTMWYDYTFADRSFSVEDLESGRYAERNWKDKEYINWNRKDVEVNDMFVKKIMKQLDLKNDRKIIFVSHMLTHSYFTVKNKDLWRYFNGYLGSGILSKYFKNRINVKYSIMGHVHYRKEYFEDGTKYICNCLNYRNEWFSEKAIDEIKAAMNIINI